MSKQQTPVLPRFIMIGGFLGAGKTTALSRLAAFLTQKGLRVGMVTNDQGCELVDTTWLRAGGFRAEEISGGCFCCRFNDLVSASARLRLEIQPEVYLAEPVGSCTDLVATVANPLRRLHGKEYRIAPVSVMVDPARVLEALSLSNGDGFSEKVRYIYLKQLEEADSIVVAKADLLSPAQRSELSAALEARFPKARIWIVSSRTGENLQGWFDYLLEAATPAPRPLMEVDYEKYAVGEALLGWFNAKILFHSQKAFDANALLLSLADEIRRRLAEGKAEIAHLKMTFEPEAEKGGLAMINLVGSRREPELARRLEKPVSGGNLILNIRAETAPGPLQSAVESSVAQVVEHVPGVKAEWRHLQCFKPGKPQPTHRLTAQE
jgi:G3E family GTPase